jgi:hypothetical protein
LRARGVVPAGVLAVLVPREPVSSLQWLLD